MLIGATIRRGGSSPEPMTTNSNPDALTRKASDNPVRPRDADADAEAELQDQDPGETQRRNQAEDAEDPLAA